MQPKVKSSATTLSFYCAVRLKLLPSILHFYDFLHTHKHNTSTPSSPFTKQAFASLLESCSSESYQLKQIHALILTTGLSIKNSLITQLLTSLTLLGDMTYARLLFNEMHKPRSFLWNTLIKGYVKNDLSIEATSFYQKMHRVGVRPDTFTHPFVLKACAQVDDLWTGQEVHVHVVKFGLHCNAIVRTELMMMYVKVGELGSADYLFETMSDRDLVAWNALIAVYVQTGNAGKALGMFHEMVLAGIKPDSVTVVSVLLACADLGCLEIGKQIDQFVMKEILDSNLFVNNARLDIGYAMNGESDKSLHLFSVMQNMGVQPNQVTYLGILSACGHAGLVREGQSYFEEMVKSNDCNIQPRLEHYACMVDLLGRSGHLEEAFDFIKRMSIEPDAGVWRALLGACTIHKNIELSQNVADILFNLAPEIASYHVLLSNIYAAAGRWGDVEKVRQKMRKKGVKKVVAYSSVEASSEVHVFHGGDRSHPLSSNIYEALAELIKLIKSTGYMPNTTEVLHDVQMEEKDATLSTHSEKLAVAFGLINVRPQSSIRVIKNLRICNDCHTFVKFSSKVTNREIIMRDKNRFHHFKDGYCSCKDFW
ncbi:hypothetical protein NE237_021328 [Protea cynaroides]|uniref:DYW domain-containing protein n=1 Tax=Protea cynaroides TaxID=273540 RepID=A0A9Q0HAX6_9MAGN|nr:hypothetical protein NE237_021328 [Protea cynaroides]